MERGVTDVVLLIAGLVVGYMARTWQARRYEVRRAAVVLALRRGAAWTAEVTAVVGFRAGPYLRDLVDDGEADCTTEPGGPDRGGRPRYRYRLRARA